MRAQGTESRLQPAGLSFLRRHKYIWRFSCRGVPSRLKAEPHAGARCGVPALAGRTRGAESDLQAFKTLHKGAPSRLKAEPHAGARYGVPASAGGAKFSSEP